MASDSVRGLLGLTATPGRGYIANILVNLTTMAMGVSPQTTPTGWRPGRSFGFAPWRLSGVVYGTLLNHPAALAALGDAVHAPPYRAPPRAPVLYVKPRNTLAGPGDAVPLDADVPAFEVGAALGIVVGRSACRVREPDALAHVAGYTLVADLSVPHEGLYRPGVRHRARDGSCLVGPAVLPREAIGNADALELRVAVDGEARQVVRNAEMQRGVARLLADVTAFMTLHPGDLLLLGTAAGAPQALAGQRFSVEADGFERLEGSLVAATTVQAPA
jgi:5-oxopent-3-ene-1,2,5-tricarboxylate decarboxylase/2-hydroxyhepta-2,4-diene-1,7-dioate isomerase